VSWMENKGVTEKMFFGAKYILINDGREKCTKNHDNVPVKEINILFVYTPFYKFLLVKVYFNLF